MAEGDSSTDLLTGVIVGGKYRIDALLGTGMMGVVYRATQLNLERPVAIKIIRSETLSNPTAAERFKREALAIARLKHAHIITIYDFGVSAEVGGYLVMEYLEGSSLREAIKKHERLSVPLSIEVMRQVCSAVQAAHESGVIHRDLKPHNIFLETASEGPIAKVLDFGVAKLQVTGESEPSLTVSGALVGTPLYISPEQCGGLPLDARSDIYSLGCVLYEMLTGRPPFLGGSVASVLVKQMSEPPKPPSALVPDLPSGLDAVLLRTLAKQPGERYQTAAELGQALFEIEAELKESTPRASASLRLTPEIEAYLYNSSAGQTLPNNLPQQVTNFVGREHQIAEVKSLLASTRLLTLLGLGGIGKTRLALQVATETMHLYPDGVWLVELASLTDPDLVAHAIASAIGVRAEPGRPVTEALSAAFKSSRTLLVLDNCEHLVATCAAVVEDLLLSCPNLKVLTTSREALGIVGEAVWRVPILSIPRHEDAWTDPGDLLKFESVRLFVERVKLNKAGFALTERNAATIADLCRQLEGIPLAIELAAARAKVLSVEQILTKMDDRFSLLMGGGRTTLQRQQTLRAAIDWSYGLLSDEERVLMRRLTIFPRGWTLEAAEEICSGDGIEEWAVLDLLTQLVDKSLVMADEQEGEGRYRMLETIRQYGLEKLRETDEYERLEARSQQ